MNALADNPKSAMAAAAHIAEQLRSRVSPDTEVRGDEPLARRTTLRVGGPADCFVQPASEVDLRAVLGFCRERGLPHFILGRGSNLLVRDGGIRGVVISLAHACFSQVTVVDHKLVCGAGAKLKQVAVEAKRAGLGGMEFLEGIPGSVGGALRMNAGAMGAWTFDVVESIRVMDPAGNISELPASEVPVQYRSCPLLHQNIALGATLVGQKVTRAEVEARMNQFSNKRWSSQPAAPSAGCIFKNPEAIPAGKVVDELGLKGTRVGGAVVSAEHGNFIINDGRATARDVLQLIEVIRQRVKNERGIDLHTEVEIIGEDLSD